MYGAVMTSRRGLPGRYAVGGGEEPLGVEDDGAARERAEALQNSLPRELVL